MPKPKPIQITIPNPCNQPWEQMTPCGQGRFCNQCQKTVIDFTTWSDAAMYRFFSENTGKVCARFLSTQTERPIHIPPQPHSRLYRMTIAMGLTLLFTQATDVVAQNRAPRVTQNIAQTPTNNQGPNGAGGEISGHIYGMRGVPLYNAVVYVSQAGVLKKEAKTDIDGRYVIQLSEPGNYDIVATHGDYDSSNSQKLLFPPENSAILNFSMRNPIDYNNPGRTVMTGEPDIAPVLGKPSRMKEHKLDQKSKKHPKK